MRTRYNSAGRVQPIEFRNMAEPGTCLLCNRIGRTQDEVFATLGVELEFYGIAYLCLECCAELADFVMFKSPEAYDKLAVTNLELVDSNIRLVRQLEEAKGLLNARINSAGDDKPNSDGIISTAIPEAERDSVEVNSDVSGAEPKPAQSGEGYGPVRLSGTQRYDRSGRPRA